VFGETLIGEVIECFREAAHCFIPVEFSYCSSPRGCPQRRGARLTMTSVR
jgi:hypothetical protein